MNELRLTILFIAAAISMFCGANGSASASEKPLVIQNQGPGWSSPKSAGERAEQQRFLTEAYARQQAQQESTIVSQQAEILKIYSKHPWRNLNGSTNYVGGEGWVQFQGKVQEIEPIGILFQGSLGKVLSISTEINKNPDLVTTHGEVSSESETRKQNTRNLTSQRTQVTKTQHEKLYGDDFFLVANFPYPAQEGNGFERMMAYDAGYVSYTNSANLVLTVRKLLYGTPCLKIWSAEEIAAAYKQAEEERAAVEAERNAQRALASAQAEEERAAIRAEKKAKIDKIVKFHEQQAEKGDSASLRRLGEFYRDGYGVEKDAAKSAAYFQKADEMFQSAASRIAEESRLKEQEGLKQKFLRNLELADKHDNAVSALYVEKCYREGIGIEKNLSKADEYHAKAISFGIPHQGNTSLY